MKGGINFEEWKEIVKKNRRSLRSKSNSFKFEPESLTYGAEKAVKSPEYGQVHTITYNVTGMEVPSGWPTTIKSGRTVTLNIEATEGYGAKNININADYTHENNVITINNVQSNLSISFEYGEVPEIINIHMDDLQNYYGFNGFYDKLYIYDTTSGQDELVVAADMEDVRYGYATVPILRTHTYKFTYGSTLPPNYIAERDGIPNNYVISGEHIINNLNTDNVFELTESGGVWLVPGDRVRIFYYEEYDVNSNPSSPDILYNCLLMGYSAVTAIKNDPDIVSKFYNYAVSNNKPYYIDVSDIDNIVIRKVSDDSIYDGIDYLVVGNPRHFNQVTNRYWYSNSDMYLDVHDYVFAGNNSEHEHITNIPQLTSFLPVADYYNDDSVDGVACSLYTLPFDVYY